MAKVGYVRVSTDAQNTARQEQFMVELGVDKIFLEKVSGKARADRQELEAMLNYIREGDTVVVHEFSRLARSLRDLLSIVDTLREKGVTFMSKKECIDTSTATGELMLHIFGALSEFERNNMLERQREGIEIAKRDGKYKGRKPVEVDSAQFAEVYRKWKAGDLKGVEAYRILGLKRGTFYRRVKDFEQGGFQNG